MKINAIKYDTTLKQGYSEVHKDPQAFKERNYASLCDNNKEDKNKFSGNFTGKSEVAAEAFRRTKIKDKVFASRAYNWLTEFAQDHNVAAASLMALFLAGALRPATIMALPGDKDREDKIYASGHSMASGVIGFWVSTIITSPWDQGIKNITENYKAHYGKMMDNLKAGKDINEGVPELTHSFKLLDRNYKRLLELQKKAMQKADKIEQKALKNQIEAIKLTMKNVTDWAIAIPRAALTIAMIPPILLYVFGLQKKSKSQPKQESQKTENVINIETQKTNKIGMDNFMHKSGIDMKGGVN